VNTTRWLEQSGLLCNLVSNMSLRVNNPRWHSIGWLPIKSMTQLNNSLAWVIQKVISIINLVGKCSNDRFVQLQKRSEWRKDKLIPRDGWPDSYPERNAFKPHCEGTITWGCRGELSLGAKGRGRDKSYHTWGRTKGYKEPALFKGRRTGARRLAFREHRRWF